MNRPVHFEIHADDLDRCQKFYGDLFGWKYERYDWMEFEYIMVTTWPAWATWDEFWLNGWMLKRTWATPGAWTWANAYVCTMWVISVDEMTKKAVELGWTVVVGKMPIPKMWWLAYLIDTEGNTFWIMESDTNAA